MNAPQLLLLLFERLSLFYAAEQAILRELSSNFVYEVLEKNGLSEEASTYYDVP